MEKMESVKTAADSNSNNTSSRSRRSSEKYGLRPRTIIKRLQQQEKVHREPPPTKRKRTKSRPAPLSKYRRKTANARERHRMKEINVAFETLRKILPDTAVEIQAASCSMTKITTLRMAVDYIKTLSDVLADESTMDLCSIQTSLQNFGNTFKDAFQPSFETMAPSGHSMVYMRDDPVPHYTHHYLPQYQQFPDMCPSVTSSFESSSSSFSTGRGSIGSSSDLEELLSDDSGLLEDNLDVFNDIPTLCLADPLDILLATERENLTFSHELCS